MFCKKSFVYGKTKNGQIFWVLLFFAVIFLFGQVSTEVEVSFHDVVFTSPLFFEKLANYCEICTHSTPMVELHKDGGGYVPTNFLNIFLSQPINFNINYFLKHSRNWHLQQIIFWSPTLKSSASTPNCGFLLRSWGWLLSHLATYFSIQHIFLLAQRKPSTSEDPKKQVTSRIYHLFGIVMSILSQQIFDGI